MADLTKTVRILFQGDDDISQTLKVMGRNIDQFGDDIQDIGAPFASATEKVLLLDAAILGLALAGIKASAELDGEARKMTNSLGLPNEEAAKFRAIAEDAYKAGWGDDLAAAFEAVTLAQKRFGDNASVDIGKVTEQAFKLQEVFGVDFNESTAAVSTLMKNFGLTATQSFDFIAKGFQDGLDGSGDFLESINEYSTQFANGGADAGQFFSVLNSGFQEGMLGTDRAADLFKEFRVRIQDESKTTRDALESIGLDPAEFEKNLAAGKLSAIEAFSIIQAKLNETDDSAIRLNAGVGLMGTQFEDLGTSAALAIDTTNTGLDDLKGKIDGIDPGGFGKQFVSVLRTIVTEFGNLEQWDTAKEKIAKVFEDIAKSFGPALENVDVSGLERAAAKIWKQLQEVFSDNDFDLTTVEGVQNAIQLVADSIESLGEVTSGIITILTPLGELVLKVINAFNTLSPSAKELTGVILGLGSVLSVLGTAFVGGGALVKSVSTLAAVLAPTGALSAAIAATKLSLTGLLAHPAFAVAAAGGIGYAVGTQLQKVFPSIAEYTQRMIRAADSVLNFSGQAGNVDLGFTKNELDGVSEAAEKTALKLYDIPERKEIAVELDDSKADFGQLTKDLDKVETAAGEAVNTLSWFDEGGKEYSIEIPVEVTGDEKAKEDIESIPTEKYLEIKLQGDIDTKIASIEASAEVAQSAFEWTAKIDIAQAEATADILTQAFESAGDSVVALSESTSDMFGSLLSNYEKLSYVDKSVFSRQVEKQQEAQNKALASQTKLNDAQAEAIKVKTEALKSGAAEITIDSSGLEPALEMVMWQILQKIQIRANEDAADFLLGVS